MFFKRNLGHNVDPDVPHNRLEGTRGNLMQTQLLLLLRMSTVGIIFVQYGDRTGMIKGQITFIDVCNCPTDALRLIWPVAEVVALLGLRLGLSPPCLCARICSGV